MSSESPSARLRAVSDFAGPWSVWVAATLRLADHLGTEAATAEELAERADADAPTLGRLLRYLVARGVFAEPLPGRFENTELSRLLLDESGWRPWFDLDGAPGIWAESWTRLLDAVRTGSPRGRDEAWYHAELAQTGRGRSYDELMEAQVARNAAAVAATYDWSPVEHIVDVGGGTGIMLRTLLAAHPRLRGTVFDLPQVRVGDLGDRGTLVHGDFFADPLPNSDAYVLSQILHGMPDPRAAELLRRVASFGRDGARILVVEGGLSDEPSADEASFDLFMLTLTGGRERTVDDFRRVAAAADLGLVEATRLESGALLVVLG